MPKKLMSVEEDLREKVKILKKLNDELSIDLNETKTELNSLNINYSYLDSDYKKLKVKHEKTVANLQVDKAIKETQLIKAIQLMEAHYDFIKSIVCIKQ